MKKLIFVLVVAALIFAFAGCGKNITLPDYDFTEDGIDEGKLYFTALNNPDFEGVVTWKFIVEREGEEGESVTFTIKTKKSGSGNKVYMRYINGDTDISTINDLTDNYYIDNVAKTVTTDSAALGSQFFGPGFFSAEYGRINFDDESEYKWEFVSKKNATIKDANGNDIETVEFEYNKVSTTETPLEQEETLRLNYRKDFPIVVRMQFAVADGEDTGTITVFILELGGTVLDSDFVPPTAAQGYTDISPDED